MLKRLALNYWPLVLIVLFIGAVLYMSRYAENRKAERQENTQASSPNAVVSPNSNGQSAQNTNEPRQYPHWIDTFTWPEGTTAWALLLTLIVIGWQSTETRGANKAANAQLETMKQKERARITVELAPLETLEFGIGHNRVMLKFANVGATHAFNVHAEGDARVIVFEIIHPKGGPFGNVEKTLREFQSKKLEVEPLPFEIEDLVVPSIIEAGTSYGETWVAFIFPEEWEDTLLLRPRIAIQVRGEIRYDDVFGENHFTKFSYDMGISKWGDVSREGSAPIRPYSPFSRWYQVGGEEGNRAT